MATIIEEFREEFPTICEQCGKPGVNTLGECKCSYELSKKLIYKSREIEKFWMEKLAEQKKEIIKKIEGIDKVKFPLGERKWCIECARRIKKELKEEVIKNI